MENIGNSGASQAGFVCVGRSRPRDDDGLDKSSVPEPPVAVKAEMRRGPPRLSLAEAANAAALDRSPGWSINVQTVCILETARRREFAMETRIDEIADRIYRLSTFVPDVAPPAGINFNQFLIDADEPMLFHCGQRSLFPSVSAAAARIVDLALLRWITFSHVESDECGSLNEWLSAAPNAVAAHGRIGCNIWLNDSALRPPRALADDEVIDLGGRRVRRLDTPHVPHCWDAGLIFEETTGTLFSSDLLFQFGDGPAIARGDILAAALDAEEKFRATAITPETGATVRRIAALKPRTIAVMHGSSIMGEVGPVLEKLAAYYDE